MTNSVSPLLTPIDVLAYQHSILTLHFDEVSDVVFHWGRVWFMWHTKPRQAEKEKIPHSVGKIGLASCEIDEEGNLKDLRKWPLPLPPTVVPIGSKTKAPEFKIATVAGSNLVVVITINSDKAAAKGLFHTVSNSFVLSFSAVKEVWYLGAYGAVTKKFRFHPIEAPEDVAAEKLAAVTVSNTILIYTHGDDVHGGFDNTQYNSDDWERTPEVTRMLDLSFYQKIQVLLPHAAPFIFLNSNVPWDEQITEPRGGKAVYLPCFDSRVVLLHNYEPIINDSDPAFAKAEGVRYKFKWPGLAIERDEYYDLVFAVTHNISADWSTALVNFRLPTALIEKSAMVHNCKKDIFSCVAGFCTASES